MRVARVWLGEGLYGAQVDESLETRDEESDCQTTVSLCETLL